MTIKLANGTELSPILVRGGSLQIHGVRRDTLTFVFPATESMEALDAAFSESACESITIINGDKENIYKGYTIRGNLMKTPVLIESATEESEAVIEMRINISIGQRTYTETQLAETKNALAALAGMEV